VGRLSEVPDFLGKGKSREETRPWRGRGFKGGEKGMALAAPDELAFVNQKGTKEGRKR